MWNTLLNIPAWAAQSVTPWILHINEDVAWETMETERDWCYLLYVILMWYYIGRRLDERRRGDIVSEHKKSTSWTFHRRVFLLLYGLFICFRAFSIPWYLEHWFMAASPTPPPSALPTHTNLFSCLMATVTVIQRAPQDH
jgi:hypothetical protein